eukprot:TRINITY_DN2878_c0_g1_i2.p1 TRINITY_DN2878_c0_g1~~TRINITY_DN2878_c0_g1_i2.p1  ORF type:complete len:608 (+),score=118.10 TRINITY_DN2878_c0_g1_i2:131-1954(+)
MGNSNSVAPAGKRTADEKYGRSGVAAYETRSCTDIPMLLLFIAFWVGMVVIAVKAFTMGDIDRLTNGVDMYGNICGLNNIGRKGAPTNGRAMDFTDKKFLYWPALWPPNIDESVQLCVEACPDKTFLFDANVSWSDWICLYNHTVPTNFLDRLDALGTTCWPPYSSEPLVSRCAPTAAVTATMNGVNYVVNKINAQDVAQTVFQDLYLTWKWMILGVAISVVVSFIWLVLLRFFCGVFVWLTIILCFTAMCAITIVLFYFGENMRKNLEATPESERLNSTVRNTWIVRIVSYIFVALTGIFLILLIWLGRRIQLAIQIIKEAAHAMASMPSIMLLPVGVFVALALFSAFWVVVSMFLGSSGVNSFDDISEKTSFKPETILRWMAVYWFFGFLWTSQFMLAFMEMVIAGSIGSWYWNSRTPESMPRLPVLAAVARTIRFHMGTVAAGSLIIAIIQFIRAVLAYLQRKLRGSTNRVFLWILRIIECCFGWLERIIKFINRNAYIMTAIKGYNFCMAARRAFVLLLSNILRVGTVSVISDFVLFLGKVFVVAGSTLPIVFIIYNMKEVQFWAIPCLIVAIASFFVASGFMEVTHMAIDTILLSFCEDSDR